MKSTKIPTVRVLVGLLPVLFPCFAMAQPQNVPVPLPGALPLAGAAPSVSRSVDCNVGQSVQDAVNVSHPGDRILVRGVCNENLTITERALNLILDGQGAATINGVASGSATIVIRGRDITIKGFTITGVALRSGGVTVTRGGSATIDGNIIQNVSGDGINVTSHSLAQIVNNTIQNNREDGVIVNESSSARIGFFGRDDIVASPNIIRLNGDRGVVVTRASNARIVGNDISQNGGDGVNVIRGAQADLASNNISANARHGILINQNSVINLGSDSGSGLLDAPNTSATKNGNRGLFCLNGGIADGRIGGLDGNVARTSFDVSCVNSLIP